MSKATEKKRQRKHLIELKIDDLSLNTHSFFERERGRESLKEPSFLGLLPRGAHHLGIHSSKQTCEKSAAFSPVWGSSLSISVITSYLSQCPGAEPGI